MLICFFNFIEVVYVKIGNSSFYLTLNLTGVRFQVYIFWLQHVGDVSEQTIKQRSEHINVNDHCDRNRQSNFSGKAKKNLGPDGHLLQCYICQSVMHLVNGCLDKGGTHKKCNEIHL